MRNGLLPFVLRQSMVNKGAELVGVWVMVGLEQFSHLGSGAAV
jgi:hypothetical protein